MSTPDTILDRCCIALEEGIKANGRPAHSYRAQRAGVAAVLEHLAYELIVLNQQDQRLTVHQMANLLKDAAQQSRASSTLRATPAIPPAP